MYVFEVVIALLLGGAGLAALARRIGSPYPALVALAGAVLALAQVEQELDLRELDLEQLLRLEQPAQ